MSTFTVRPSNSEKETFRVKLTAASLLSLKLKPGDIVLLQLPNDASQKPRPAIAWENSGGGMKDTIIQASKVLQELYEFKLGDRIGISRCTESLKDADNISVKALSAALSHEDQVVWQTLLAAVVPTKHDILAPGQKLTIEVGNKREDFEVVDVGGLLGRVTDRTKFNLGTTGSTAENAAATKIEFDFSRIGGLQNEIYQVEEQIELLLSPELAKSWSGFRAQHGLLLYGTKGTGKTLLIEALSNSRWGSVNRWAPGTKLPALTYPALIIADLWDLTGTQKGVSELLTVFRDVRGTQTLIVAETRHPNDVSERLRTKDAFAVELELPVPDLDKRLEILRALRQDDQQPTDGQLNELAARTHGFVGTDLDDLLYKIWISAYKRAKESTAQANGQEAVNGVHVQDNEQQNNQNLSPNASGHENIDHDESPPLSITIAQSDIDQSLSRVRPSALQQVFLEKPTVRWTDIGGQHALKHRLTTAVNRTLSPTLRKRMLSLGLEVTKGVLLYGPPGCSKTLLAKALANEAELNFLAVKGAELISMYVGESERATREVFRKARAAAPSILFFDEIDAIASRSSSQGRSGRSSELNVLTTLLNEMDGFEELRNVIVVAATNKPQQIDPALLRPGRFDNVVYVGLPDVETRREIFEKRFRNIQVEDGVREKVEQFAKDTEGYSGAEVVAICKAAGELALDADRDSISVEDVGTAILTAARGVSTEVLEEYERWNEARKGQGS